MKQIIVILVAAILILVGCTPKETVSGPKHNASAKALIEKLRQTVADGKMMFVHQDDLMYGHNWRISPDEKSYEKSDVKNVCGKLPAMIGFDLGGIEMGDEKNLDSNYFYQIRDAAIAHYKRGGAITLSWHPRNPLTGGDAWDISSDLVVSSIIPGGVLNDKFEVWLTRLAEYLKTFKADGKKIPLIFRPWHEQTGSWSWWGTDICTAEEFQALWEYTYDFLTIKNGLTNLVWAYSPDRASNLAILMDRYPGDEYIDIIGYDCYCGSPVREVDDSDEQWASKCADVAAAYTTRLSEGLDVLSAETARRGKILALTETGSEGLKIHNWWTEVLYPVLEQYPVAYILAWRNACDKPEHFYGPFAGGPNEEDFVAFAAKEKVQML